VLLYQIKPFHSNAKIDVLVDFFNSFSHIAKKYTDINRYIGIKSHFFFNKQMNSCILFFYGYFCNKFDKIIVLMN